MRDNGYKNAAYALAELIDNSIQAGASSVEVLCAEEQIPIAQRVRRHVTHLAVLDNGSGMDARVLRMALQFGNGTHLEDRVGIGRFGMGLPSASISQCRRVDVWTWQDGADSAVHAYISVDEIASGKMREVPDPTPAKLPELWRQSGKTIGRSGTLVVWSKIDRCQWRTATAIFRNSEFLIGRMYRRFLSDGHVAIRFAAFMEDSPTSITSDQLAVLNDPCYLMTPSSCPSPYDSEPMFLPWGEEPEQVISVPWQDEMHDVVIRFSYAKEAARKGYATAGSTPHGRHAGNNVGVSIMRAGRELELSQAWTNTYDPRERWWGVEVEFPPALDEVFGVSNNKQSARHFTEIAEKGIDALMSEGESATEAKDRLLEDGDPSAYLIEVSESVRRFLGPIRKLIETQTKGSRTAGPRRYDVTAEQHATKVTEDRKEHGYYGQSDVDEQKSAEERIDAIQGELQEELGLAPEDALTIAQDAIVGDFATKYKFVHAPVDGPAFFTVRPTGGVIMIRLNIEHPAYQYLIEILEDGSEDEDADALRRRLDNALDGLKLLLAAWARYEDEQPNPQLRERAQEVRSDWGRLARRFLSKE
ncbi:MAG: ATP-binding protein [Coriobacteriia bacterium]